MSWRCYRFDPKARGYGYERPSMSPFWLVVTCGGIGLMTLLLTKQQRGVSRGMFRSYFVLGGVALVGITLVPNLWLQGLLLWLLVTLLKDPMVGVHLSRALPLYLLVLAGVLVLERLTVADVWFLVSVPVGLGGVLAMQVAHDAVTQWGRRDCSLHAGQENVNNTQAISLLCTAAALGLALWQSPWWWLAVAVVASPLVLIQYLDWTMQRTVTMGPVVLAGMALGCTPLLIGWWILALVPFVLAGLGWGIGQAMRHEKWWDSGRIRCWYLMLLAGWWSSGWRIRLMGRGWQSWVGYQDFLIETAIKTNRKRLMNTTTMMSTAHNEFVQLLFEQGAIGFVLLVGYCATSLWRLGHGGAEAHAVYLVGLSLIGVACVLHPWTWTHGTISEVNQDHRPEKGGGQTMLYTIGSPALNWLVFLIILLVEVTR